ncbi:PE domain-containing protein [Nocardia colli]|uniref:PE domain-containing protein n=1 Tax=Nocardia colli TaxID=2545717 RepID=A0A5N0DXQ9_9NOCA|nr:PE domain-containing protein [Nocardia colli]KAA8881912.1 PE domain-containing protein [Nocardia colli]
MALEITPGQLPVVAAQLHAGRAGLEAVVEPARGAMSPGAAATDSISTWVAEQMSQYSPAFLGVISDWGALHRVLADQLPVVDANYQSADLAGGSEIDRQAASLPT